MFPYNHMDFFFPFYTEAAGRNSKELKQARIINTLVFFQKQANFNVAQKRVANTWGSAVFPQFFKESSSAICNLLSILWVL